MDIKQYGYNILHYLFQHGVSTRFVKALLATEIRRIIPTAAGLPMELGLYTSAVAAADVHGQCGGEILQSQKSDWSW